MSCKIEIDNFQQCYRPGNVIIGKLKCTFTVQQNVIDITVKLTGNEHTGWNRFGNGDIRSHLGVYTGTNTILTIEKTLSETDTFDAGSYEFPFTIELPKNIPSTYHSGFGLVKYSLLGTVHPPNTFSEPVSITVVSVIDIEDVNISYLTPVNEAVDKEFIPSCCFPSPPDRLTLDVHMPQRAIIQGDEMKVTAHVANLSELDVKTISLVVGQVIEYKADTPEVDENVHHSVLFTQKKSNRYRVGDYTFHVLIPMSKEIPNLNQCKYLKQTFYLQVSILLPDDELKLITHIMVAQNITGVELPSTQERTTLVRLRDELEQAGLLFSPSLAILRALIRNEGSPSTNFTSTNANQSNPTRPQVRTTTVPTRPQVRNTTVLDQVPTPSSGIPPADPDPPPPSYESVCGDVTLNTRNRRGAGFEPSAPSLPRSYEPSSASDHSPILQAMPMPFSSPNTTVASSIYPPEATPYPTEDALTKWDNVISALTTITPSTNSVTRLHQTVPNITPLFNSAPTETVPDSDSNAVLPQTSDTSPPIPSAVNSSSCASSRLPYPPDSSPPVCNNIGFAVLERVDNVVRETDNVPGKNMNTILPA